MSTEDSQQLRLKLGLPTVALRRLVAKTPTSRLDEIRDIVRRQKKDTGTNIDLKIDMSRQTPSFLDKKEASTRSGMPPELSPIRKDRLRRIRNLQNMTHLQPSDDTSPTMRSNNRYIKLDDNVKSERQSTSNLGQKEQEQTAVHDLLQLDENKSRFAKMEEREEGQPEQDRMISSLFKRSQKHEDQSPEKPDEPEELYVEVGKASDMLTRNLGMGRTFDCSSKVNLKTEEHERLQGLAAVHAFQTQDNRGNVSNSASNQRQQIRVAANQFKTMFVNSEEAAMELTAGRARKRAACPSADHNTGSMSGPSSPVEMADQQKPKPSELPSLNEIITREVLNFQPLPEGARGGNGSQQDVRGNNGQNNKNIQAFESTSEMEQQMRFCYNESGFRNFNQGLHIETSSVKLMEEPQAQHLKVGVHEVRTIDAHGFKQINAGKLLAPNNEDIFS